MSMSISLTSVYAINTIKNAINQSIDGSLDSINIIIVKILYCLLLGGIATYFLKYQTGYLKDEIK